jgi:hypothetical protein
MRNGNKSNLFSTPSLLSMIRNFFEKIPDPRKRKVQISIPDCLMAALAVFHLKYPSLLKFDEATNEEAVRYNLKTLYGIEGQAPCDTQMRSILDKISPKYILPLFPEIVNKLNSEGKLDEYRYLNEHYLVSIDGTGEFSSKFISCDNCCTKTDDLGNTVSFYHQLLCAVIVHPDKKQVITIAAEPIIREHNQTKNDCERNASKRLLRYIKEAYPDLSFIILEDGLASNAPHINLLKELDFLYIIGVKEGDHEYLFSEVQRSLSEGLAQEINEEADSGDTKGWRFVNNLPINKSNKDVRVNFIEYCENDSAGNNKKYFTWVSNININKNNVREISTGGRTRWKVENETFNTLKNQGYNLEHNYGHGDKHLSTVFVFLMLLAFLIDQVQELFFDDFKKARKTFRSRTSLWDRISSFFVSYYIEDWDALWNSIIHKHKVKKLEPDVIDTS